MYLERTAKRSRCLASLEMKIRKGMQLWWRPSNSVIVCTSRCTPSMMIDWREASKLLMSRSIDSSNSDVYARAPPPHEGGTGGGRAHTGGGGGRVDGPGGAVLAPVRDTP